MSLKSNSFIAAAEQVCNKYVFSLFLNTDSDEADVASLGRPRRQVGTSSCSVEANLSLRRCGMSATHVNDDAK